MRARIAEEWAIFLVALQFLTRLPVPSHHWSAERMAATPRWYPAVGLLVGAIAAAVFWVASLLFPPVLAAMISTVAGILATGAFHEDGFADLCDGIGGGVTRVQALEIMRDSRLGTYGALGLGLTVGAKLAALASLPVAAVPAVLLAAHPASRASSVVVIATSRYLRDHGTGKPVAGGLSTGALVFAVGSGALATAALCAVLPAVAVAGGMLGLVLGHWLTRRRFEPRLGGYTGDCLGAVQQTSELGFYLGVLACL